MFLLLLNKYKGNSVMDYACLLTNIPFNLCILAGLCTGADSLQCAVHNHSKGAVGAAWSRNYTGRDIKVLMGFLCSLMVYYLFFWGIDMLMVVNSLQSVLQLTFVEDS
jgi:hypothetical protein